MSIEKSYNDVILREPPVGAYIFGGINGVPFTDLMPSGVWDSHLVIKEFQSSLYFDTWNCVAESATTDLEMLFDYLLENNKITQEDIAWLTAEGYLVDGEVNFSARAIGALAHTKVGVGNDYHTVAQAIADNGLIPESRYFFDLRERDPKKNNPEVYYQDLTKDLLDLGLEFKKRFKIYFESVWFTGWEDAIKQSPLQVFVNAWYIDKADGLYYNPTGKINHAVVRKRMDGKQIFDTYDPVEKQLKKDYDYHDFAVKFSISPQTQPHTMQIQKYQTYLLIEGKEQKYAFGDVDGLLIADKGSEIFAMLNSAARLGGLDKVRVISATLADWNSVDHFNFKKQKIWDAKTQKEVPLN